MSSNPNPDPSSTVPGGNASPSGGSTVDLDQYLHTGAGQPAQPEPAHATLVMPEAHRICLVGVLADDSGSMCGLEQAVIEGLNLSVEAFRGAKGSDFFLDVRGFHGTLFRGALKDVQDGSFNTYGTGGNTPLVSHAISLLKELHAKAEQYRNLGIPATVALLLVTDGLPEGDEAAPDEFPKHVQAGDYVVGMGIAGHEAHVATFKALFQAMGIAKVVTPRAAAAEVRHAINQFSQSVASIAAA
ncbi:MAG: hypothetical protein Q8R16_02800 [bacterium]|nr:hypothetical protein [bacterium]